MSFFQNARGAAGAPQAKQTGRPQCSRSALLGGLLVATISASGCQGGADDTDTTDTGGSSVGGGASSGATSGDGDGDGDSKGSGSTAGDGDGDGDGDDDGVGGMGGMGGAGNHDLPLATGPVETIDLLFVIDNSVSMGEKQSLFAKALPAMVDTLLTPPCKTDDGQYIPQTNDGCVEGSTLAYPRIDDVHIGIISSSLGGNGANLCQSDVESDFNDRAHLIPKVRSTLNPEDDPHNTGFLSWSGGDTQERDALIEAFANQVMAVDERGCGFEAPLEAWYRFLVDPAPPQELVLGAGGRSEPRDNAVDEEVLAQRDAFLRPEGIVAVVVLTDENDCSMMGGGDYYANAGFGYLTASTRVDSRLFSMAGATAECDENPNDRCCFSCLQRDNPPLGCEQAAEVCMGTAGELPTEKDPVNLRCFEQQRRFGVSLLYPTQRYVDALTQTRIVNSHDGSMMTNPLMVRPSSPHLARDPSRVFFAGIVGVPWQDVATNGSLDDSSTLTLLSAAQLKEETVSTDQGAASRWDLMVGRPGLYPHSKQCQADAAHPDCGAVPVLPLDPFMIESVEPRPIGAQNPISGDAIVSASSTDPMANAINGHEVDHGVIERDSRNDDLQYACIFPLETPRVACSEDDVSCDCSLEPSRNRPLCQPPEGGLAENTQHFAKAYPGTRILEVLRDVGDTAVVGSICPKIQAGAASNPNYGYNPVMLSLIERIGLKLEQSQGE